MPRTRLPGPACATCRAKSRRCDRTRPACGRCVAMGLDCGGYPEKYRFCGLASRGKWKDRQAPTTDDASEASSSQSRPKKRKSNASESERPNDKPSTSAAARDHGSSPSPANTPHPITPPAEELFGHASIQSFWMPPLPSPTITGAEDVTKDAEDAASPVSVDARSGSIASHIPLLDHIDLGDFLTGPIPEGLLVEPLPETLLAVIDEALVQDQTEVLLAHYHNVICPHQIQQDQDDMTNPYRAFILPLAYEQTGLLYAVLGLSASHLGHVKSNKYLRDSVAVEYRLKSIQFLADAIKRGITGTLGATERDTIFATIQILLLHDISESGISENGVHISGAVSICCQSLGHGELTEDSARSVFFLGNLVWLDIVRSFAHPERVCFPKDVRETIISLSDEKLEMVNGCPRDVMALMGDALDRAKAFAAWEVGREEHDHAVRAIIRKLYSWNSSRCTYPSDDPRWVSVAEAFRHTCLLRCLRLIDATQPAEDAEIQESVTAILDATSEIPGDCGLLELMVLPLFMAGADCLGRHSRHYIMLRLAEIKGRSEMGNRVPQDLLNTVWEARSQKLKHDRKNVPWMPFTHNPAFERQHDYLIL